MNIIPAKELSLDQIRAEEIHFNTMVKRSEILARSSLLPTALRNKAADVLIIMMMAQELDIPPLQALNGINVIQGKPVISPQLMIALIRAKVPESFIDIKEEEGKCSCSMARNKDDKDQVYTSTWTLDRAEKMGLVSKDNWKKQAGTMLKWRAVSEAARTVFPDVIMGLYIPDELEEESGELREPPKPIDIEVLKPKEEIKEDPDKERKDVFNSLKQKISDLTNKFTDETCAKQIQAFLGGKSMREIATLPVDVIKEMVEKLNTFKKED